VIDAPDEWDRALLEAFERLPQIGFLAASLVNNPHDQAARVMYEERPELYRVEEVGGVTLLRGPIGGGCAMTSRELHDRVGGFKQQRKRVFFLEDEAYIRDIERLGFQAAYLRDVEVLHAGGSYYAPESEAKHRYWKQHVDRQARKDAVKRLLLRLPLVRPLNKRVGWFEPPPDV
jgi:GT2 family glycosyltransferase